MKKYTFLLAVILFQFSAQAQSVSELINEINELMITNYVFLDKAEEIKAHLESLNDQGYFDKYEDPEELTSVLTDEMRKITNDKHLRVRAPEPNTTDETESTSDALENLTRYQEQMIMEIKHLDHNVSFFDMRYFGGADRHFAMIDVLMDQLKDSDAIIIDMRYNGGGSPRMAQYLTSYFFDTRFLLNTIVVRSTGFRDEMWVVDVGSDKQPDIPVFILTSQRTFSGAEDFSYTMQQHANRATIVGEVTGGGAHPTRYYPLANGYGISIPFARTVNPVTNTNWEGVGVIPDVKVSANESFDKAYELAKAAAIEFREISYGSITDAFNAVEGKEFDLEDNTDLEEVLKQAVDTRLLTESDINLAGYHYLNQQMLSPALAILAANCTLFPESVNVYDSFAEALAADGQNALALEHYEKAVSLAYEQEHPDREFYKQNMEGFKERM